jgi:hypothetical protein
VNIAGLTVEAFPLLHSTRAPAVGYRLCAGRGRVFYASDVAWIEDRQDALNTIDLYVGDGATISCSMVRKPGREIIGHAPVQTQLTWCGKEGVAEAIFTHLGTEVVTGDERTLRARLRTMGEDRGVQNVTIAYGGMERVLR